MTPDLAKLKALAEAAAPDWADQWAARMPLSGAADEPHKDRERIAALLRQARHAADNEIRELQSTLTLVEAERDAAFNDGVEAVQGKLRNAARTTGNNLYSNFAAGLDDWLNHPAVAVPKECRPTTQPEDKSK